MNIVVVKSLADCGKRFCGLLTDNSLVMLCQLFKKRKESTLVRDELEAFAKLLCDGEQDFVILLSDQS